MNWFPTGRACVSVLKVLVKAIGAEKMSTRSCQDTDARWKFLEVFKTYRKLI